MEYSIPIERKANKNARFKLELQKNKLYEKFNESPNMREDFKEIKVGEIETAMETDSENSVVHFIVIDAFYNKVTTNTNAKYKQKFVTIQFIPTLSVISVPYNAYLSGALHDTYGRYLFGNRCGIGNVNPEYYKIEFNTWKEIMGRCFDAKHPLYKYYGALGAIPLVNDWLYFETFVIYSMFYRDIYHKNPNANYMYFYYYPTDQTSHSKRKTSKVPIIPCGATRKAAKEILQNYHPSNAGRKPMNQSPEAARDIVNTIIAEVKLSKSKTQMYHLINN